MPPREEQVYALRGLIGTTIEGRYRVDKIIALGGMGAVFRAHHIGLKRDIALKVLYPELTEDAVTVKRFELEASSASKLDHANCVRVMDYGTAQDGTTYLAMELLEGTELRSLLGSPMPPARAVDLIVQVLQGLEHAHHHKIVHRDLKPENVFVTRDFRGLEVLKLVDFGIAKVLEDKQTKERLTKTGFVFGTPYYMSPEQAMGEAVDGRSDLYAAGLILYEMLSGTRPYRAIDAVNLIKMKLHQAPYPLPDGVPVELSAIVMRLLAKSPSGRFESARAALDFLAELRPRLEGLPAVARPIDEAHAATVADQPAHHDQPTVSDAPAASTVGVREPAREPIGAILLAALALLIAAGSIALLLRDRWLGTDETGEEPAIAAEPATGGEDALPAAVANPESEDAAHVVIRITTNVAAEILDADSGEVLGRTNAPRGIVLPTSSEPTSLVLKADGHDEVAMDVVPNRDKAYKKTLVAKVATPEPSTEESKKPTKKSRKKGGKSPDLKDPFDKNDKLPSEPKQPEDPAPIEKPPKPKPDPTETPPTKADPPETKEPT